MEKEDWWKESRKNINERRTRKRESKIDCQIAKKNKTG